MIGYRTVSYERVIVAEFNFRYMIRLKERGSTIVSVSDVYTGEQLAATIIRKERAPLTFSFGVPVMF